MGGRCRQTLPTPSWAFSCREILRGMGGGLSCVCRWLFCRKKREREQRGMSANQGSVSGFWQSCGFKLLLCQLGVLVSQFASGLPGPASI